MPALDTNIVVRWLVADDAEQTAAVARYLADAHQRAERLYLPVTVVLELEWVLRSRYGFDKASVITALDGLLSAQDLDVQHEDAIERALWLYRPAGAPDFADALHTALAALAQRGPLVTLDQRAARLDGALLLA